MIRKTRMGKCDVCNETMEYRLLHTVIDKKMCLTCGNDEIDKWNRNVAEVEQADGSVTTGEQKG
jgi:hypothetical protein